MNVYFKTISNRLCFFSVPGALLLYQLAIYCICLPQAESAVLLVLAGGVAGCTPGSCPWPTNTTGVLKASVQSSLSKLDDTNLRIPGLCHTEKKDLNRENNVMLTPEENMWNEMCVQFCECIM